MCPAAHADLPEDVQRHLVKPRALLVCQDRQAHGFFLRVTERLWTADYTTENGAITASLLSAALPVSATATDIRRCGNAHPRPAVHTGNAGT